MNKLPGGVGAATANPGAAVTSFFANSNKGSIESQLDQAVAENARLRAEIARLTTGATGAAVPQLERGRLAAPVAASARGATAGDPLAEFREDFGKPVLTRSQFDQLSTKEKNDFFKVKKGKLVP